MIFRRFSVPALAAWALLAGLVCCSNLLALSGETALSSLSGVKVLGIMGNEADRSALVESDGKLVQVVRGDTIRDTFKVIDIQSDAVVVVAESENIRRRIPLVRDDVSLSGSSPLQISLQGIVGKPETRSALLSINGRVIPAAQGWNIPGMVTVEKVSAESITVVYLPENRSNTLRVGQTASFKPGLSLTESGGADDSPLPRASTASEALQSLVQGINKTGFNLYIQEAKQSGNNLLFSPLGIHAVLTMTALGASGTTAEEMRRGLNLPIDGALPEALENVIMMTGDPAFLMMMNSVIWYRDGFPLSPAFIKSADRLGKIQIKPADFLHSPSGAEDTINEWSASATPGVFPRLLQKGTCTELTGLIPANITAAKAGWISDFPRKGTRKALFHFSLDRSVPVDTMIHSRRARFAETDELQALELPFKGRADMIVILPRTLNGWKTLESSLRPDLLDALFSRLSEQDLVIHLPRFFIKQTHSLKGSLSKLGFEKALTENRADFLEMTASESRDALTENGQTMHISDVFHQVYLDVREEGIGFPATSPANAALEPIAPGEKMKAFRANRPFFFVIRDRSTGIFLFLGRLIDPT